MKLEATGLQIDSLAFLPKLLKLNTLNLSGSTFPAEEMTYLTSLPELKQLSLADCSLSTIESLENAASLTTLDLSSNTIRKVCCSEEMAFVHPDGKFSSERFLQLWTAKEAYLKKSGWGILRDLRSLCLVKEGALAYPEPTPKQHMQPIISNTLITLNFLERAYRHLA